MALCLISDAARHAGVSADTLRYYERVGLLRPDGRSAAGYRLYDMDTVERVRFIKGAKRSGLRLREIAELLEIRDRGDCPCGHTRQVVEARLTEIDNQLEQLAQLRDQLTRLLVGLDDCTAPRANGWPCETVFAQRGGDLQ